MQLEELEGLSPTTAFRQNREWMVFNSVDARKGACCLSLLGVPSLGPHVAHARLINALGVNNSNPCIHEEL